ncbi:MAG: protease, partial [Planctomycetota bacterium]
MRRCLAVLTLWLALLSQPVVAQSRVGYYRSPTIHGKTVIFTSEGDLWRVPLKGGVARRLTSHLEVETNAEFSPDGKTIAFTASYEGPAEIYTMPANGGRPKRVTWEGYSGSQSPYPVSWKSDSDLLYATRYFARRDPAQLAVVDTKKLTHVAIPLEQASDGVFDASGETLFFTRLPRQSSHAKRYRGGYIENLWKFKNGAEEATPLTADFDGTSRAPMLWKNRIYFVTDRDDTMNLWSMRLDGSDLHQLTKFEGFDVLAPDLHKGVIVFQLGADLWRYDIESDQANLIDIKLATDFDQKRLRWLENPLSQMSSYRISADGKHIALTVRGRGFVVPAKLGRVVRVPQKPGTRYRSVAFVPQTNEVYYLSDETGETEFWSTPASGFAGQAKRITNDADVLRYGGLPSPDGSTIAYTDRDQVLWLLDIESGKSKKVIQSQDGSAFDSPDLAWSSDSRWLAFSDADGNSIVRIYLLDTQ